MQFSFGLPPEFINQFAAAVVAAMRHEIKAAAEAATVAKDVDYLLTVKEAADRLKLCEKTVLAKIADSKIAATNAGTWERPQYRISKAALTEFYNINRTK